MVRWGFCDRAFAFCGAVGCGCRCGGRWFLDVMTKVPLVLYLGSDWWPDPRGRPATTSRWRDRFFTTEDTEDHGGCTEGVPDQAPPPAFVWAAALVISVHSPWSLVSSVVKMRIINPLNRASFAPGRLGGSGHGGDDGVLAKSRCCRVRDIRPPSMSHLASLHNC